ncbi:MULTISPECIES: tyrosine-protein phosphatase [unclassified Cellulophaga]|uniref:tyrosine-protein phosphatase n=1 Tax=unclassified Cellulophaga TaxID=2634405 RepID=UPI0026E23192|nr:MULTISPECIES: CpsB/CapC family capsule biosynthesis tyrosine phosphatase [unclassified Cellulophaga]MDO6491491.1 histidinol phosphatase [Cellulophaga sp. 2_MG-2023]MDO6493368.1 histidinol phosphatase [Cellulophaga sp. 3_MG-2023]
MFHFFSKKYFLVDYLEGYTDIHNHILPGIDDGAKTPDESLEILDGFSDFGVTNFICSPHIMSGYYPNNPHTITSSLAVLKNELKNKNKTGFTIDAAAEHMVDPYFEELIATKEYMPLKKDFILIEMSFLQESINFKEAVQKLNKIPLSPILAHPERYAFAHNRFKDYNYYKELGTFFQLNLLSLCNYYGPDVHKTALKLLDSKMYNFIGSDIHNIRQLKVLKEIKLPLKTIELLKPIIENTNYNFG